MSKSNTSINSPALTASPAGEGSSQKYSCVICSQRKVRCDRNDPCGGCVKAHAQCVYVAPQPPRRGKRKTAEELQVTRQKRVQGALQSSDATSHDANQDSAGLRGGHGGAGNNVDDSNTKHADPESGKLVVQGGRSKYIVNNLWKTLTDDTPLEHLSDGEESTDDNLPPVAVSHDAASFVLGGSPAGLNVPLVHPGSVHMFRLWQTYIDNVDPLVKIVHTPSFQQQISVLSGNTESIPKPTEALMFAIYAMAILSMSDSECDSAFGKPRSVLLARYQDAARQALINASYLRTSDIVVLQAYFLFLCAIRPQTDADSLWALTGIALRIAERMGLHKDGATHGLNPFQVELRRRLWWQLLILDGQTAQLTGSSVKLLSVIGDTKKPLNINDSDLYPDMQHDPAEHKGPTQMCFVRLRVDTASWLQQNRPMSLVGGGEEPHSKNNMAEKDKSIDDLEAKYEECYIHNYDRSIPLHFLTMIVASIVICKIRWMANNPQRWASSEREIEPELKDQLLSIALKILECELLIHSHPTVKRFTWHGNSQSQWNTFIYVLNEVRQRCEKGTFGSEVARAWALIDRALEARNDVLTDHRHPLHVAVSNAALAAWEACEKASDASRLEIPSFIRTLRLRRDARLENARLRRQGSRTADNTPALVNFQQAHAEYSTTNMDANMITMAADSWQDLNQNIHGQSFDMTGPFDAADLSLNPVNWSEWDLLLQSVDAYGNPIGDQTFLQ